MIAVRRQRRAQHRARRRAPTAAPAWHRGLAITAVLVTATIALTGVVGTSAAFSDSGYCRFEVTAGSIQPQQDAWNGSPLETYGPGDRVIYNGHIWEARWPVGGGSPPGADGQWGPWMHVCHPGQYPAVP